MAANTARGFKTLRFCGFTNHQWSETRYRGFMDHLGPASEVLFHSSDWAQARRTGWETQQARMVQWLLDLPKPIGVMACNDFRGQHVLEACRVAQITVPDQVAVIGVDNDRVICDFCQPSLSRLSRPLNALASKPRGAGSVDAKRRTTRTVAPIGIAARQSTDVMEIDDTAVVTRLKIIRERACNGFVADILAEVPIARSSLERRFRQHLGRSPQAEIRNIQMRRAQQLLSETNLPLSQIANLTGFKHAEYFSVVFKREMGETPGQYRENLS